MMQKECYQYRYTGKLCVYPISYPVYICYLCDVQLNKTLLLISTYECTKYVCIETILATCKNLNLKIL